MKHMKVVGKKKSGLRACSGSTLVEVLVFSTLALFVLGSSFPLLSRLMASDKAHEERLAAFTFLQKSGQQLRAVPYGLLTNGFVEVDGKYEKNIASTNFYKNISARYKVHLVPTSNGQVGDYYKADLELRWSTRIGGLPVQKHVDVVFLTLLPDL